MENKETIIAKMAERGFIVYANIGKTKIQFVSSHMYDVNYNENTEPRKRMPIINVIVDFEKEEFECRYNIKNSINSLVSPVCGSVLNDDHFDRIVCTFESHAKWLEKLTF